MNAVVPIEFTMPDGAVRHVRATNGARRRIANHFGEMDVQKILSIKGDGALSEIAYMMMYDADGKPPEITLAQFSEAVPWGDGTPLLALVLSAFSQGVTSPNEMLASLQAVQELSLQAETPTGSTIGPFVDSPSDSQTETSGTGSSSAKLTLLAAPTVTQSEAEPS